ncbi:MAG: diguanylate cyclase, partial [Acidobacteriota bacterium]
MKRTDERFSLLADIAGQLLESDRPLAVLDDVCRRVMTHLDCQVFLIHLIDEDSDRLRLHAHAGISPEDASTVEWLHPGVIGCGLQDTGGACVLAEASASCKADAGESVRPFGLQACACRPLLVRD